MCGKDSYNINYPLVVQIQNAFGLEEKINILVDHYRYKSLPSTDKNKKNSTKEKIYSSKILPGGAVGFKLFRDKIKNNYEEFLEIKLDILGNHEILPGGAVGFNLFRDKIKENKGELVRISQESRNKYHIWCHDLALCRVHKKGRGLPPQVPYNNITNPARDARDGYYMGGLWEFDPPPDPNKKSSVNNWLLVIKKLDYQSLYMQRDFIEPLKQDVIIGKWEGGEVE